MIRRACRRRQGPPAAVQPGRLRGEVTGAETKGVVKAASIKFTTDVLKVGRGADAPPFIVMDVIAAANARQAALPPGAPQVIRMEVGQPGTGAPAGAVAAAVAALRSGDPLGYTEAFGRRSLRERIVAHYRDWYGLDVPLERVAVTVGASGGVSAGLPGGVRSGRPGGADLAVLSALREHPDRARHAAGDPGGGTGDAVPAERRDAGEARSAAGRADRGEPVQSRRHDAASRRTGRHRGVVRRRRRAADQRRDLSRAELRQPDRHGRVGQRAAPSW